jgi:iron complex outermembrane receptor protein
MTLPLSHSIVRSLRCGVLATALATTSALCAAQPGAVDIVRLDPLVVTTTAPGDKPLEIVLDPKAAAQPIPAQDGADILKRVPGFSVSRKGGADGEAVLRGQAGSRLNLLLDGESALGGCPHRMDPPTAYIFPAAFDRVTILKGPQTVLYGPGNSAGVVLFERDVRRLEAPRSTFEASLTAGSFGRNDEAATVRTGGPDFYVQAAGNRSASSDYRDGDGQRVNSRYERSSAHAAAGWTPDANTLVELSATVSEGHAAYGYSMMDATRLDRENVGLRFRKSALSPLLTRLEGQVYSNFIDHVMDNYSLRTFTPSMMGTTPAASNPDHRLFGGRGTAELAVTATITLKLGADFQNGHHRSRSTGNQPVTPYPSLHRDPDASIDDVGVFGEFAQTLTDRHRVIAGLRLDAWSAHDQRTMIAGMMSSAPNPTANAHRAETHPGGFVRYEHDLSGVPATAYLGVGYTERAPDYWELITNESLATKSSFHTRAEKTTQLDTGLSFRHGPFTASVSAFANDVHDYILVQSNVPKSSGLSMGGMGMTTTATLTTVTRNIAASAFGGEAALGIALADHWKLDASLAYVQGRNQTDRLPLAQQPPLEVRLGFAYATPVWSVGGLARLVSAQSRFALNQGTIIGQDLGRTGGFAVYSFNAGWRVASRALLTAGVDNVFDQTYAEHLSRSGGGVTGYPITTRINEPGRTLWLTFSTAL